MVTVCAQCGGPMTAQRSTRCYCSDRCRQRATRSRKQRAASWQPACEWCAGPLDRWSATRRRTRLYCSPGCKRAARRWRETAARYRDAEAGVPAGYRDGSDPGALTDPVPCWRSAQWHRMAGHALALLGQGWTLAPPDPGALDMSGELHD